MGSLYSTRDLAGTAVQGRDATEGAESRGHDVTQQNIVLFGVVSTIVAAAGICLSWLIYLRQAIPAPEERASALYPSCETSGAGTSSTTTPSSRPLQNFAVWLWRVVDTRIIDGTVNGVANVHRRGQPAAAPGPDRAGHQLRAGDRARHGGAGRHLPGSASTSSQVSAVVPGEGDVGRYGRSEPA